MKVQRGLFLCLGVAAACMLLAVPATAALVALEDFDGGAVNLVSSSVTNLDGGSGDFFGVGSIGGWPQGFPPGVPFGLVDDSVVSLSNPANPPFPADNEAVYGQAASLANDFFAISDTREWTAPQLTASWTFDISGFTDLELCVDMGGIANGTPGYSADSLITFTYQIDGGPSATALSIARNLNFDGYSYRAMDSGTIPVVGTATTVEGPLEATGPSPVTKILVDSGLAAANTLLDKSPATGTGAGLLDTFGTALAGSGSQLTLTMSAILPFEAMAFDNITIKGVPEPGSLALLSLGTVALFGAARRRR